MFHFRIITTPDGNQIIDRNLSTPYESLTPTQMVEYTEIDNQLTIMDRLERKARERAKQKQKWYKRLASACGLLQKEEIMEELLLNQMLKANYYALFIAITKNMSAKSALKLLGIYPEKQRRKAKMNKMKGYTVPNGYMGYVNGKYMLFETEKAYHEYLLMEDEV